MSKQTTNHYESPRSAILRIDVQSVLSASQTFETSTERLGTIEENYSWEN